MVERVLAASAVVAGIALGAFDGGLAALGMIASGLFAGAWHAHRARPSAPAAAPEGLADRVAAVEAQAARLSFVTGLGARQAPRDGDDQ